MWQWGECRPPRFDISASVINKAKRISQQKKLIEFYRGNVLLISSLLTKRRQSWRCHGFSSLSLTNGPQCGRWARWAVACPAGHKASSEPAFYLPLKPGDCFQMLPTWLPIISPQDHNPGSLIKKRGDEGLPGCGGSPGSGLVPRVVITGLPLGPQIATCNLSLQ